MEWNSFEILYNVLVLIYNIQPLISPVKFYMALQIVSELSILLESPIIQIESSLI